MMGMASEFINVDGVASDEDPLLMNHSPSSSCSSSEDHVVLNVRATCPPLHFDDESRRSNNSAVAIEVASQTGGAGDAATSAFSSSGGEGDDLALLVSDTINTNDNDGVMSNENQRSNPLNSGVWIVMEVTITVSQIIASIIVLALSRHEKPQAPLHVWVLGYALGCLATLPLLYWRYSANRYLDHSTSSPPSSYVRNSAPHFSHPDQSAASAFHSVNTQEYAMADTRINLFAERFKMTLDCFFAIWFVVGNVWIFGGHSSSSEAPNLYRLCIVFLTFSCIGYAMPFIVCATICCCLPCIISVLGFRESQNQTKGASSETINSLPTYKFKGRIETEPAHHKDDAESDSDSSCDGGFVVTGTENERAVSAEDAMCCICLHKYKNNVELRELPCSHHFHVECVDKWLKINASCPLCKHEISVSSGLGVDSVGGAQENINRDSQNEVAGL